MKKSSLYALVAAVALIVSTVAPVAAQADEVYTFVIKKQEDKAINRWSLEEWLATRDRMRLMDLWLALHTPSPFEFYVGGAYQFGSLNTASSYTASEFTAAAYASIFGLELDREGGPDTRYDTTFNLRFFGYHYQATHMRLELGVRNENNGSGVTFQNALAGVGLAIYLAKYFGIDGRWRHAFASTPNASGLSFGGDQYEGGAFIDFSFLRFYGKYIYETLSSEASNLAPGSVRSGPQLGVTVFF